jgi:hypothetical protein
MIKTVSDALSATRREVFGASPFTEQVTLGNQQSLLDDLCHLSFCGGQITNHCPFDKDKCGPKDADCCTFEEVQEWARPFAIRE